MKCDLCGDPVERYILQNCDQVFALCYFCHKQDIHNLRSYLTHPTKPVYKEITQEEYLRYKKLEVFK